MAPPPNDGGKGDDEKPEIGEYFFGPPSSPSVYSHLISGPFQKVLFDALPHDYPQIALLIQSHARSIETFMPCLVPCEEKK